MTTANLMNVPSVKGKIPAQIDASKKLQEENLEVAEVFAGLMNQTIDLPDSVVDDTSSNMDVSKTDSTQSLNQSYERYSYKDKQINEAKAPSIEEKLEESGEALEQAGQEVIDTLCENYGVDEETIQNLLEANGLSALDLLNPQNLVSFIVQLTGIASGEELLLDENFLNVMETLSNLAEGLMKDLNVDMNGLQELVAQMDIIDTEVPKDFQDVLEQDIVDDLNVAQTTETTQTQETQSTEQVILDEKPQETQSVVSEETKTQPQETEVVVEESAQQDAQTQSAAETDVPEENVEVVEKKEVSVEKSADEEIQTKGNDGKETIIDQKDSKSSEFQQGQDSQGNSLLNHNSNENIVITQTTANVGQAFESQSVQQFSSYLSADTVQIMEQIVQQMRVTISSEITTMEMQMNPENLGKVYVNISSEEGVVNAQFHATNELVKEALEAQVATLRESLNQAGVKVNAIEVTIASHEFERNLEQNHKNPEEQMLAQEENTKKRRNLNLDSLDELTGMMTEEEALVAQIMKDNGNSVDFTA